MAFKLEEFSFHVISVPDHKIEVREISGEQAKLDVENYIIHILDDVTIPKDGKKIKGQLFQFKSMSERVPANLLKMLGEENSEKWRSLAIDNAEKLLDVESSAQEKIVQLGQKIRKGCLLQVGFSNHGEKSIALIKIDDNTFLDTEIMHYKQGLPRDTRMQKVAIVSFTKDFLVRELFLSDTNNSISKYWREDYLEAEPVRTSSENTTNAFNAIDALLKREVRKKSKQDYYYIRNQVVLAFRNESFDFNKLIDDIKAYSPVQESFSIKDMENLTNKMLELPDKVKGSFDTQFVIDSDKIKARLINKIVLDDFFELRITQPIENLKNKLGVDVDSHGRKFVKIYSDTGYTLLSKDED